MESLTTGPELENSQGQSLPKRTSPVAVQVRNGPKADQGMAGKSATPLHIIKRNLSGPNAVSPATPIG